MHQRFNSEDEEDVSVIETEDIFTKVDGFYSSSDDEAPPESITIHAGKADTDARNASLRLHRLRVATKQKEFNRARDLVIRERSKQPQSKPHMIISEGEEGEKELSEEHQNMDPSRRMERALQDADEEDEDNSDGKEAEGVTSPAQRDDSSEIEEDEDAEHSNAVPYLADAIFAAAVAASPMSINRGARSKRNDDRHLNPKRKRSTLKVKEKVVNSRTIRTVAHAERLGQEVALRPSRNALKFARNSEKPRKGRWERRDARLNTQKGIHGPPHGFARL